MPAALWAAPGGRDERYIPKPLRAVRVAKPDRRLSVSLTLHRSRTAGTAKRPRIKTWMAMPVPTAAMGILASRRRRLVFSQKTGSTRLTVAPVRMDLLAKAVAAVARAVARPTATAPAAERAGWEDAAAGPALEAQEAERRLACSRGTPKSCSTDAGWLLPREGEEDAGDQEAPADRAEPAAWEGSHFRGRAFLAVVLGASVEMAAKAVLGPAVPAGPRLRWCGMEVGQAMTSRRPFW